MSQTDRSCDSVVTLFFDGLEIIYFQDEDDDKRTGVVLLPKRDDHVPNLDIFTIVENTPVPIPHDIDLTRGLTIALQGGSHSGVSKKDSFSKILNLQGRDFHDGHLKFICHPRTRPIKIEIRDGAFFTAASTKAQLIRFEVSGKLSDLDLGEFADIVGADIELSPGSKVNIYAPPHMQGMPMVVELPYVAGRRYAVVIKNVPISHHPPIPRHSDPLRREVTHFYFYYDLVDDDGKDESRNFVGPRFDLALSGGMGIPPQNCDPIVLDPTPPLLG